MIQTHVFTMNLSETTHVATYIYKSTRPRERRPLTGVTCGTGNMAKLVASPDQGLPDCFCKAPDTDELSFAITRGSAKYSSSFAASSFSSSLSSF